MKQNILKINRTIYTQKDVEQMSVREIGDLQAEIEIEIQSAKEALERIGDENTSVANHQKNCIRKKINMMHYAQKWIGAIKKENYLDEYKARAYNEKFVKIASATLPKFMLKKIEKAVEEVE